MAASIGVGDGETAVGGCHSCGPAAGARGGGVGDRTMSACDRWKGSVASGPSRGRARLTGVTTRMRSGVGDTTG